MLEVYVGSKVTSENKEVKEIAFYNSAILNCHLNFTLFYLNI